MENKSISVFEGKNIRKTWFNNEWWFVMEGVCIAGLLSIVYKFFSVKKEYQEPPVNRLGGMNSI